MVKGSSPYTQCVSITTRAKYPMVKDPRHLYLSIYRSIYLSIDLSICMYIYIYIYIHVYISMGWIRCRGAARQLSRRYWYCCCLHLLSVVVVVAAVIVVKTVIGIAASHNIVPHIVQREVLLHVAALC